MNLVIVVLGLSAMVAGSLALGVLIGKSMDVADRLDRRQPPKAASPGGARMSEATDPAVPIPLRQQGQRYGRNGHA